MKERPIIFSGEMVKALLAGTKTQTRRIVADKRLSPKLTLLELFDFLGGGEGLRVSFVKDCDRKNDDGRRYKYTGLLVQSEAVPGDGAEEITCPYGVAGDRLWVREAFSDDYKPFIYRSSAVSEFYGGEKIKWRSPYHMRRISSRITLEITKVRVERLQDISEEDAEAEGVEESTDRQAGWFKGNQFLPFTSSYMQLWDSLHGKGAWDKNPWVWVLEFRRTNE